MINIVIMIEGCGRYCLRRKIGGHDPNLHARAFLLASLALQHVCCIHF